MWLGAAAALIAVALAGVIYTTASREEDGALRTSWGDPDLQGVWTNNILVPLERSPEFGTRAFMTEEEHAKALAELLKRNQRPGRDSREGSGTEKDVARAYNDFWFGDKPTQLGKRTSMITDPPDGRIPALTPEATKRIEAKREFLAALLQGTSGGRPGPISPRRAEPSPDYNLDRINRSDGPEDRGGPERCFGNGLPVVMATGTFGGVMQLVQAPDSVSIYYDVGQGQGFSWVIPITNRPHLPANVRLYRGDATGRWEGNTLVVETTNLNDWSWFDSKGTIHSDAMSLVERFEFVDPNTMNYRVTVTDPKALTRPFTMAFTLKRRNVPGDGWELLETACVEGERALEAIVPKR
jgi:hypothetical protein